MIKPYECTQCGSTEFEDLGNRHVHCKNCGTRYEVLTKEPKVVIAKGANVVFGKNAKVEVRGDIQVEDGAKVDVEGHITVLSDGKPARFELKRIADNGGENGRKNR